MQDENVKTETTTKTKMWRSRLNARRKCEDQDYNQNQKWRPRLKARQKCEDQDYNQDKNVKIMTETDSKM